MNDNYDVQLTQITEKTSAIILQAKRKHEKNDDAHFQECYMISNNEDLKNRKYHLTACYKKFTRIVASKTIYTKTISFQNEKIEVLQLNLN